MAVNRIDASANISKVMDSFYESIRGYDKVAWCMGPVPYEVMFVAGVGCFLAENTATRIASAHVQDEYLDYSKAAGLGVECCSYAKINIGQALMMRDGKEIPERFRLPKPDFIALGDACASMMQWARCLGEIFDVPVFVFDMPFVESDSDEEAMELYKQFAQEVVHRAAFGISSSDHEKYRIMWRGNFPWYKVGALSRMFDKYGAVLIGGCYALLKDSLRPAALFPPLGYPADDPLLHVSADYAISGYSMGFDPKYNMQVKKFIDDFSIDAVIIHSPHTCRPWGMGAFDMCNRIKEEYGIPAIVLELDHTDESYFNDAQVETRVQALLEEIDAQRAMGKGRQI